MNKKNLCPTCHQELYCQYCGRLVFGLDWLSKKGCILCDGDAYRKYQKERRNK